MGTKHTLKELNNCSREELITIVLMMQGQLDTLNENVEKLIEQVRIANQYRFGRHTETLESIDGQLSFFDEADALCDDNAKEPEIEEVLPTKQKKKSKRPARRGFKGFSAGYQTTILRFKRRTGYLLWRRQLEKDA